MAFKFFFSSRPLPPRHAICGRGGGRDMRQATKWRMITIGVATLHSAMM